MRLGVTLIIWLKKCDLLLRLREVHSAEPLLDWLSGFAGNICFNGADAHSFKTEQIHQQHVSYIEQNMFLFGSTIRDDTVLGEETNLRQNSGVRRNNG